MKINGPVVQWQNGGLLSRGLQVRVLPGPQKSRNSTVAVRLTCNQLTAVRFRFPAQGVLKQLSATGVIFLIISNIKRL